MSRLLRTLQLGFKSLMLHKLRTGLAMLGILIGVTAVVWLVALGEGVSYQAQLQIKELGATNIIIKSIKPTVTSEKGGTFLVKYGLTRDDFAQIVETVPTIVRATPMREIRQQVRYRDRLVDVKLVGCTPDYYDINHLNHAAGRFLEDRDIDRRDNVAVIAAGAASQLFPYESPVGKTIQILNQNSADFYTIIGQTESREPSAAIGGSLEGRDYNLDVYIPLSTLRARIGDTVITARSGSREGEIVQLSQITVTVGSISEVEEAAAIIQAILERSHDSNAPDFAVTVPKELLRQAENLRMMFNILLVLIAGISLIVGGIGIMNIMLATVTERTQEIGVRRAMGAKRRDIIYQFLAETTVLSGTGGVLGVLCGFLCWPATAWAQEAIQEWRPDLWSALPPTIQNLEPLVAPELIGIAFSISVIVGVLFGLYPARRAALMDPIEALRHE